MYNKFKILTRYSVGVVLGISVISSAYQIGPTEQRFCDQEITLSTHEIMHHQTDRASFGNNFNAFTSQDILSAPPDMAGAVGPTQYLAMINGWIRSFNKTTGRADNIINVALARFFAPITNNEDIFDVRIVFDRLSGRWFMLCEDGGGNNNMFIAVSDGPNITVYSKWRFFKFKIGSPGFFADYPTLGIDANALYVGVSLFPEPEGSAPEAGPRAFVLPKAPFVSGGTPTIFVFNNLTTISGDGAVVPQGVNNVDPSATIGYFAGINNFNSALVIYRVSNPGTVPTLSSPIFVTAGFSPFEPPIPVPTKNGQEIDGGDSRLLSATIRNNQLWTVHGLGVSNTGNSSNPNTVTRDGCRWYQVNLTPMLPTIVQSGTLFTASAFNDDNQRSYIFPSVMVSGQGNMALGSTTAGAQEFINAMVAYRLATDAPGALGTPMLYTASSTPFNNQETNRWGDYGTVTLDPCDDMTMWSIQQYCNATDQWACRVVQIKAPGPATPTSATGVPAGSSSEVTNVSGASVNGTAFYDPGVGFGCRIRAQVSGGVVVNSITFVSPTQVQLNVSTIGVAPGDYNVTITNPDGQSAAGAGILTVF